MGFSWTAGCLVQACRYLTQELVGFQDFSQRPSCLKGSHPPTHLSIPSAQWASVPSWTLAAQHPILFDRRQRAHGRCQPRAGPGSGEELLLSTVQSHARLMCGDPGLCLCDRCFTCASECREGQVILLLPHRQYYLLIAAQTRWSVMWGLFWCVDCVSHTGNTDICFEWFELEIPAWKSGISLT